MATSAFAQTGEREQQSVALFEEARKLVESGDCPAAIPKLQDSLALNESVGAHLSLAECYEKGDPLLAWRENKSAERVANQKDDAERADYARAKAAALAPRLAMLRVTISVTGGNASAVALRIDGAPVVRSLVDGGPVALDPGRHRIEASAPGRATWRKDVELTPGRIAPVDIRLEDPADQPESVPPADTSSELGTQRTVGLIVGGVGLSALGVGAVAGIVALSEKAELDELCGRNGGSLPDDCGGGALAPSERAEARGTRDSASALANVSSVGVIAGGALLLAGVVLYVIAPSASSASRVRAGLGRTSLELRW